MKRISLTLLNVFFSLCLITFAGCKKDSLVQKVGGISSGGTFVVSMPLEKNLFIQEYWHNGAPRYLIYNQNSRDVELNFHIAHMHEPDPSTSHIDIKKGNRLIEPIFISAQSYMYIDATFALAPLNQIEGSLLGIFENTDTLMGTLFPPKFGQVNLFESSVYTTAYGMNGLDYNRRLTSWMEFPAMEVSSQEEFDIDLKVTGDFVSVHLAKTNYLSDFPIPALTIVSAFSSNLRVEDSEHEIIIYKDLASIDHIHSVSIRVRAPTSTTAKMGYLKAYRCEHIQNTECVLGYDLSRGILIRP